MQTAAADFKNSIHGKFGTILADPPWQFQNRNVTELVLFGVRGSMRTLPPGRRQVNFLATQKRENSRKPDEFYEIVESCSPGPYLELFARHRRENWGNWGNEVPEVVGEHILTERKLTREAQLRLLQETALYVPGCID